MEEGKFHFDVGLVNNCLAGKPIVTTEEGLRSSPRREGLCTTFDFNDALMAGSITAARGRYLQSKPIGEVEEASASLQAATTGIV